MSKEQDRYRIERLEKLDSCAVSDALDALDLPGSVIGLKKVWDCGRVVGRTVTVKLIPKQPNAISHRHLGTNAVEAATDLDVVVVDNQGRLDCGAWGGILSFASKEKGIRGIIIDGACRDADECREVELPVWSRGTVTRTARNRILEHSFNEPVQVETVTVSPNDYVIADMSGVVFIPSEHADEVIAKAEMIYFKEQAMIKDIKAGKAITEVMGKNYETMLKGGNK